MEDEIDKAVALLRSQVETFHKKKDDNFEQKYAFLLSFLNLFFNQTKETQKKSLTDFRNLPLARFTRTLPEKYGLLRKANPTFKKLFQKDWDLTKAKKDPASIFPRGIAYYLRKIGYSLRSHEMGESPYFSIFKS